MVHCFVQKLLHLPTVDQELETWWGRQVPLVAGMCVLLSVLKKNANMVKLQVSVYGHLVM